MASNIKASISITDNFTPQLRNMSNAISAISANLNDLEFSKKLDPSSLKNMTSAAQALDKSVSDLEQESKEASQAQNKHNKSLREGTSSAGGLTSGFKSLMGAIGGVVSVAAGLQGIKKALNWSDELTTATARLNMVNDTFNQLNGTSQTTKELQDQIFQAAQASRGSFGDMQSLVASLGNNAKEAFTGTDEIVKFSQVLNEAFVLGGSTSEQMSAATMQLSQALSSGALKGDELNSILENAPGLTNILTESLGVSTGQLKEMGAEGELTSDIIKNALLGSADDIHKKFSEMPVTFSQLWTSFKNSALHAFAPVSEALNNLANSPEFQAALESLTDTITSLAPKLAELVSGVVEAMPTVMTAISDGFSWLVDNGDLIISIIGGVVAGFLAFETISFVAGVIDTIKVATEGYTLAQAALNVVMNMNPFMLIATAIGAVVSGLIYLWNTNEGFRTAVIEAWNAIVATFQQAWVNISSFFSSLAAGWDEALITVQNFWFNLSNQVSSWWTSAQEWGTNLINGFKEGLGQAWGNIESWISDKFGWITNKVKSIFGIASPSTVFIDIGSNLMQGFWDGLKNMWGGVESWVSDKFGWLTNKVKSIFGIASPSTVFTDIGSNLMQGFWDGLQNIWGGVEQWATDAWESIKGIFSGGDDQEETQIVDYTAQIETTKTQLAQLQAEVQAGYDNILQTVISANAQIVAQGITMFTTMSTTVIADSANMVAGINANLMQIPQLMGAALLGSIPVIQQYFALLQEQMVAQVNVLIAQANAALLQMVPTFQSILESLKATSLAVFLELQNEALLILATMGSLVTATFTNMSAAVTTVLNQMSASCVAIWTTMSNLTLAVLQQFITNAQAKISGLVATIQLTLSPLPGIFSGVANSAMLGFIAGIQSQTAGAVDATNKLVQAVKDAFVKGLGIHSPSDVTYWFGQMTGEGFIEGLSDSQLAEFAKQYLNEIVDAFIDGKFSADDLVEFLGDDSLKVIEAIQNDPELMEKLSKAAGGSMVQVAQSQVGYRSPWGSSNSKYNMELGLGPGAWCAMFVKWCADHAGVYFPPIYYVPGIMSWAKANGRWEMSGHPGDAVILRGGGHVGIYAGQNPDGPRVIDGNTWAGGGGVGVYDHTRTDVVGFVHLDGSGGGPAAVAGTSGTSTIAYPLPSAVPITSRFGHRSSPGGIGSTDHKGVDMGATYGTPILSSLAGSVKQAGWNDGYGNSVTVSSGSTDILYGHMSSITSNQGQQVNQGQQIGLVGSTGNSTGPHLHFEIRQNGVAVDPMPYLEGAPVNTAGGGGYGGSLLQQIQDAYNRKYGINVGAGNMDTTGSGLADPLGVLARFDPPASVAQWADEVVEVLDMLGEPRSLLKGVLWAINGESGGDPNSTYLGDVNVKYGGSKGLLQTITPQFAKYRNPSLPNNMYDPRANIYACLNEMRGVYGSIAGLINRKLARGHWSGYATGTRSATAGVRWVGENGPELIDFEGGERVYNGRESRAIVNNTNSNNRTVSTTTSTASVPVTVNVNVGTINNNEDLNLTIDRFKGLLTQAVNDVIFNEPMGKAVG